MREIAKNLIVVAICAFVTIPMTILMMASATLVHLGDNFVRKF